MRTLIAWILTLAVGATASAQVTAPPARKVVVKPGSTAAGRTGRSQGREGEARGRRQGSEEMDKVLAEWERRSKKVITLDVLFDRIDHSPGWGNQYYQGRAMLQSPNLACLEFQKYKVNADGKPLYKSKNGKQFPDLEADPYERIVCTGKEVLQYSWDDRKIFVFPARQGVRGRKHSSRVHCPSFST